MKNKNIFLSLRVLAALLLSLCLILSYFKIKSAKPAMATKNDCVIIIDPGHGGPDSGAVALDETMEKDINLDIALYLKDYFTLSGFYVELTREDDLEDITYQTFNKAQDMENRVTLMNSFPNAVVISIHQNNFEDKEYKGAQVFYSENMEESKSLANLIQKNIRENIQQENTREIKKGNEVSCILSLAENPAVIVECGFLSNVEELNLLKTQEYKSKMAFSIYSAVVEFLNNRE